MPGRQTENIILLPVLSALENVMLPLQIQGHSPAKARQKVIQRLTELGLEDHIGYRPHKLSGGQQQRVAIARALIADPALIVADEPTANLDSDMALKIIDLMRQLNRQHGRTFVFPTHDQRLLQRVNRRILLRDGCIAEDKTVA
jgi:putative ABC transport system ATP-binding protein